MGMFLTERKCPICGKHFFVNDKWAYRRNDQCFCSWGCLRAHDKQKKRDRSAQGHRLDRTERNEINRLLMLGLNPQKIADRVGVTVQAVMYYKQKAEA